MDPAEIKNLLKVQPFNAFIIVTSSGDRYTVTHPENLIAGLDGTFYVFDSVGMPEGTRSLATIVNASHINALEPMGTRAA